MVACVVQVNQWLLKLKDDNISIAFPEFVEQYSSLFAGSDPGINSQPSGGMSDFRLVDVVAGETGKGGGNPQEGGDNKADDKAEKKKKKGLWRGDSNSEDDSDDEAWRARFHKKGECAPLVLCVCDLVSVCRCPHRRNHGHQAGKTCIPQMLLCCDECDLQLAELKGVFDRFAVDGNITPPETCQVLINCRLLVHRTHKYWTCVGAV
jgi:hypothetical protein